MGLVLTMGRSVRLGHRYPLFLLLIGALVAGWLALTPAASASALAVGGQAPVGRAPVGQDGGDQPRPAAAGAPQLSDSPVLKDLLGCLADRKVGDLVLLIDTSGSLGGAGATDPTGVRVAAAQALVTRLASSFAQINANVDVSIAGFDDDVTPIVDFVPLTGDAVPSLTAQLQSFATRDKGAETDYWSALTWLNSTLQAKAQTRGAELGASCQFAIWFTDGEFTISARDGQSDPALDPLNSPTKSIPGFEDVPLTTEDLANSAKAAAEDELCRVGGPADQMRAAGVTLIGVGLGKGGADDPQFSFMRNYVENESGSCGGQPSHGIFVPATSVGDLFLALDGIGQLGAATQGRPPQPVCPLQVCPQGTYSVQLDNTLSKVHLAAVVDDGSGELIRSGIRVEIAPPGGAPSIVIDGDGPDSGTATTTTASAGYQWYAGNPLTVDLTRVGPDWSGEWKLTFIDTTGQHPNAVTNINLSLTSDFAVVPTVTPGTPWRVGQPGGEVEFNAETLEGDAVAVTDLPPGFTITATLTLPGNGGTATLVQPSLSTASTVDIPADVSPGLALVKVDLDGQVAGQPLGTVSRQVAVQILPPLGAPSVAPNQVVDFGAIEGVAPATATLTVTGPDEGDGCASVTQGSLISTPRSVTSVTITGPDGTDCFPVPAGQSVPMQVTLQPGQEGNGLLEGEMTVRLAPASDPGKVTEAPIRYRVEMERLPAQPVKIAILIIALLLGLLIPLALIWLVRRLSARFPSGEAVVLQSIVLQIKIGAGELTAADGRPLDLPQSGWTSVPAPGRGRRSLMLSGVLLSARAGWRLTEPGYAEVDDAGSVGACSAPPRSDSRGRARLPLSVQGTWTVLVPHPLAISPLHEVSGRLLLVVDTASDDQIRRQLISSAERDAPAAVEQSRQLAKAAAPTSESEPPASPAPTGNGSPYPAFGQPAAGGWGAPEPNGWGGAAPAGWPGQGGGSPAPAPGDWGSAPPGGPGPGPTPAPGQPRGSDGW